MKVNRWRYRADSARIEDVIRLLQEVAAEHPGTILSVHDHKGVTRGVIEVDHGNIATVITSEGTEVFP